MVSKKHDIRYAVYETRHNRSCWNCVAGGHICRVKKEIRRMINGPVKAFVEREKMISATSLKEVGVDDSEVDTLILVFHMLGKPKCSAPNSQHDLGSLC